MAGVLGSALICRQRWPNQRELSRKIVHIGTGPVLPLAWFLRIPIAIAVPFAVVVTVITLINHRWHLLPAVEDVGRKSYGTVAYGVAICLLLILFWAENPAAACAGVLVMAFGDGLAGLIGRAIRSPNWTVLEQRKSLIGTSTMAITSAVVLFALVLVTQSPLNPLRLLAVCSLAVGLEQMSVWGIDNLSVPLGVALSWTWMTA
ncbi:diacylglycerol/polyprenol kinase family protein [Synechococcus sp. WH 8016]|uniref:diacylglycerol/polyprenol kinase family protein n=1 Tax=Synechococcus sp. WH 8016 TaxID=166318 RepID=UPI000237D66F|nr:phosphatidate cytidylyltransferase [Synechococcus sp. WH 8016]